MAKRKTYRIICKTDLYHAQCYPAFNKNTGIKICKTGLLLKEAQRALLGILNMTLEMNGYPTLERWGKKTQCEIIDMFNYSDGTRAFTYDVFAHSIEEETDDAE